MRLYKNLFVVLGLGLIVYFMFSDGISMVWRNVSVWTLTETYAMAGRNSLSGQLFNQKMAYESAKRISSIHHVEPTLSATTNSSTSGLLSNGRPKVMTSVHHPVTPATALPNIKIGADEKWVILHTYMRGGSTFLGTMFDKNPDAFYMFEPLFPIYFGMLGVPNTIHPLRIYANKNATQRTPGELERRYMRKAIMNMFTCNFDKLPLLTLANHYMDFTGTYEYASCLHRNKKNRYACMKPIWEKCPSHLEVAFKNNCHLFMAKLQNDSQSFPEMELKSSTFDDFPSISNITNCLGNIGQRMPQCLPRIEEPCQKSKLKVFKIIRGSVALFKEIMTINPNTYLIHQVRDPRGIVMSRKSTATLSFELQLEGKMLCKQIRRDLKELKELHQLYPERIKHIRYEDMARDVLSTAHSIYMFLGEEMHRNISRYLENATHSSKKAGAFNTERRNSTQTAFAWRTKIPKDIKQAMDQDCLDVLKRLKYDL